MKLKTIALSLLALALGPAGLLAAKAHASPNGSNPIAIQDRDDHDRDWDAPPQEFREAQRRGYHDGVEAARDDFHHHRSGDIEHHDSFRHPHVAREDRDDYREGFRRGYDRAMRHMNGEHYQ